MLKVVYPLDGYGCPANQTFAYGCVSPGWALTLNRQAVKPISPQGFFSVVIPLTDGLNTLHFVATSPNGLEQGEQTLTVIGPNKAFKPTLPSKPTTPLLEQSPRAWHRRIEDLRMVLDAGHGGSELGTIAPTGVPEKDLNLRVALAIEEALKQAGLTHVFLTRREDRDVSLQAREVFVEESKAHLSLSIHHNALPDDATPWKHEGTSVHYYHPYAQPLAQLFLETLITSTGQPNDGVIHSSFAMTRLPHTPGLLLELGYTTHPNDAERILAPDFPQRVAAGIVSTVIAAPIEFLGQAVEIK
ncbi:MAG: N-acetylmuramoyl-L-alanine amidase [Vampirovibrionales bacterium]|nr:N-acetylmuramoyl-L-alanine amidase [Vampirovibrionales bacterium]